MGPGSLVHVALCFVWVLLAQPVQCLAAFASAAVALVWGAGRATLEPGGGLQKDTSNENQSCTSLLFCLAGGGPVNVCWQCCFLCYVPSAATPEGDCVPGTLSINVIPAIRCMTRGKR